MPKPRLTREILENNAIYFCKSVHKGDKVPLYLRALRDKLLAFDLQLPIEHEEGLCLEKDSLLAGLDEEPDLSCTCEEQSEGDQESDEDETSGEESDVSEASDEEIDSEDDTEIQDEDGVGPFLGFDLMPHNSNTSRVYIRRKQKFIEQYENSVRLHKKCFKIALEAVELEADQETEDEWMLFYRRYFFERSKNHSRVDSRRRGLSKIPKKWTMHQNLHWNAVPDLRKDQPIDLRTTPKPDLTYAFKITRDEIEDNSSNNFSLRNLGLLRSIDGTALTPSPTKRLGNWNRGQSGKMWRAADLMCYPWAVVEVKRSQNSLRVPQQGPEIFCYCQAANACADAMHMRETLLEATDELDNRSMIAFTCIGPSVRLWLCSWDAFEGDIKMVCIWATTVKLTWGVMALRLVIANMTKWANGELWPCLDKCLQKLKKRNSRRKARPRSASPRAYRLSKSLKIPENKRGRSVSPYMGAQYAARKLGEYSTDREDTSDSSGYFSNNESRDESSEDDKDNYDLSGDEPDSPTIQASQRGKYRARRRSRS